MTKLSADDRWRQWCDWFEVAYNDVQLMAHDRHVWVNVKAMLEASPPIDESGIVTAWLVRGVARNHAIGLRRQTDTSGRCPTIASILKELSEHPEIASRKRFMALASDPKIAKEGWRRFSAQGLEYIDAERLADDRKRLQAVRERVRGWVNKRIAHLDLGYNAAEMSVTMADIWLGVDLLCEITQRYYPLFHPLEYLAQVTPDPPPGWLRPFDAVWKRPAFEEIDANAMH